MVEEVRRVGDEQARDEEMVRTYKEEEGGGRCEGRAEREEWGESQEGREGGEWVGRGEKERVYLRNIRTRKGPLSTENWLDHVWREWRLSIPVN